MLAPKTSRSIFGICPQSTSVRTGVVSIKSPWVMIKIGRARPALAGSLLRLAPLPRAVDVYSELSQLSSLLLGEVALIATAASTAIRKIVSRTGTTSATNRRIWVGLTQRIRHSQVLSLLAFSVAAVADHAFSLQGEYPSQAMVGKSGHT